MPGVERLTVAGDKAFDTADFVAECRNLGITPQVAQNLAGRRSATEERTPPQPGYRISQKKWKRSSYASAG